MNVSYLDFYKFFCEKLVPELIDESQLKKTLENLIRESWTPRSRTLRVFFNYNAANLKLIDQQALKYVNLSDNNIYTLEVNNASVFLLPQIDPYCKNIPEDLNIKGFSLCLKDGISGNLVSYLFTINENGLLIESNDFNDNIRTVFYDHIALREILSSGILFKHTIRGLELLIANRGIKPDREISVRKKISYNGTSIAISVVENNELVFLKELDCKESYHPVVYAYYYEYMRSWGYYKSNIKHPMI